ncbi:jg5828 [Pararge aegeria aegeria]|uniref:Jg5828 protein n=1 Tax=Pararge aegeria aegeria TaxID=348720 RepID=A0A8S4RBR7_9NEOP|nr:jg5828 [Pararge aegeria aegeria]
MDVGVVRRNSDPAPVNAAQDRPTRWTDDFKRVAGNKRPRTVPTKDFVDDNRLMPAFVVRVYCGLLQIPWEPEGEHEYQVSVGFIVHKSLINSIVKVESVSSRVASSTQNYQTVFVVVYTGTGENRSWKGIPDLSGADQKRRFEALRTHPLYIDHVGMQILTVPCGSEKGGSNSS